MEPKLSIPLFQFLVFFYLLIALLRIETLIVIQLKLGSMYVKLLSAESVGFLVICNVEHHWKKKKDNSQRIGTGSGLDTSCNTSCNTCLCCVSIKLLVLRAEQLRRKVHECPFLFTTAKVKITACYSRKCKVKGDLKSKEPDFHSSKTVCCGRCSWQFLRERS